MTRLTIEARPRTVLGKKVKNLRKQGVLPANVYGHDLPSRALALNAHDFSKLQRRLSASSILDLVIDGGRAHPVMIHRTQRDVRTGMPSHIEFFQINPRERLTAAVPLVLTGQPELVRRNEAILLHEMVQIEVTCLPSDLPEAIEIRGDLLTEIGAVVHVSDLQFDRAKLTIKAHPEDVVASLSAPQQYAEPEALAAEAPVEEGATGAPAAEVATEDAADQS